MTALLQFHVVGVPATQGSKTGFVVGRRAIVVDKNPARLKPWREAVRSTAVDAAGPDWIPISGPVAVRLLFALPQPASAPKRTRTWPTGARSGDIDKLTRSCLDSLTDAAVWLDDSQVVSLTAVKDYPGQHVAQTVPGVLIQITRPTDTEGALL